MKKKKKGGGSKTGARAGPLMGREVRKLFGDGKVYAGRVVRSRTLRRKDGVRDASGDLVLGVLYRVEYEDGDCEEMELHELKDVLG